jgi:hypothetical protein
MPARRIPSDIRRLGAAACSFAPSRLDISSGARRGDEMRMPQRRPRAVYEVYDAEDRLAEQPLALGDAALAHDEQAPPSAGAQRDLPPSIAAERRSLALRRLLAGAALCAVSASVLIAIAMLTLRLLTGAGSQPRKEHSLPAQSATARHLQVAPRTRARHADAVALETANLKLRRQAKTRRRSALMRVSRRAAYVPRSVSVTAGSFATRATRGPAFIVTLASLAGDRTPYPSPDCACIAAAEFGFER